MLIKRIVSGFCAIAIAVLSIITPFPQSESLLNLTANAAVTDTSTVSRAEWISGLMSKTDKVAEAYPDNYFSDIAESDKYYDDILTAVGLGLIDNEAGDAFEPESPATRDFAAHSLNVYLGFVKSSDTYSFSDSSDVTYKDDAQVAVERGWFALESGKFLPNKGITKAEMNNMLGDTDNVSIDIDPNHKNTYVYADGVVEIPDGTAVDIRFENDNEIVTITNSPKTIAVGNVFVVYYNKYPCIYRAGSVSVSGNTIEIVTAETDRSAAVVSMDMQVSVPVGIRQFEGAEGSETYYIETEEQARMMSESRGIKVNKDSVIVDLNYDLGSGVIIVFSAVISNIDFNTWGGIVEYSFGDFCGAELTGDVTLTAKVNGDLLKAMNLPKNISLGSVSVYGVGKVGVDLNFKLSASGSVTYAGNFIVGVHAVDRKFRFVSDFYQSSCTSNLEAEADIGLSLKASVDAIIIKGSLSANVGVHGKFVSETFDDGELPAICSTASAYLYAYFAADAKFLKKNYHYQYDLFTAKNSPIKVYYHIEDGKTVPKCTRVGRGSKLNTPYVTAWDSPYFSTHYAGNGSGWNKNGEPYSIFDYTLDSNGNATISKYRGNAAIVSIPEKLDGHTVTAIGSSVFSGHSEITSVSMPDTIVKIGVSAFSNCTNLHNIDLAKDLTTIGRSAFYNCIRLTSINIPKSLSGSILDGVDIAIGYSGPFGKCDNLTNVVFENGTTAIVGGLFYGCDGLREITIPDTVVSIGNYAFRSCNNLSTVNLSKNLTSIGVGAFRNCQKLSNVNLPKTLTTLKLEAFYGCSSLVSIEIPKNLTGSIIDEVDIACGDSGPFGNCENLTDVTFEKGITAIPGGLFYDCSGLKEITIPNTVTIINEFAFRSCSNLQTVNLSKNLTTLKAGAFRNCTKLDSIVLPNTLTTIWRETFYNCTSLTSIEIPKNLSKVGDIDGYAAAFGYEGPFAKCDNLEKVTFNNGLKAIPDGLFWGCTGLKTITIPDTITSIGWSAFRNCTNIQTVYLPSTLEYIGNVAFANCTSLQSIELPDSIKAKTASGSTVAMSSMFSGCENLKTVKLPKDLTIIGENMFNGCKSLESINLPANVTQINSSAFLDCENLKTITIPNNVKSIGSSAFKNCTSLESISLSTSLTDIYSEAFKGCTALKAVTLPNSVKTIGTGSFSGCEELKDVKLSNSLTVIPDEAFRYCYELESISIPNSVTKINKLAFGENIVLADVYFGSKISEIADDAFSYPANMTFHGPRGTRAETYAKEKDITFEETEVPVQTEVVIPIKIKKPTAGAPNTSNMTVAISGNGVSETLPISADGTIELSDIADGNYKFTFSANNCVPRTYDVSVSNGVLSGLEKGVELHLIGDVTGDGRVNSSDVLKAKLQAKGSQKLSAYDFAVADITKDGKVNSTDILKLKLHAKGSTRLW